MKFFKKLMNKLGNKLNPRAVVAVATTNFVLAWTNITVHAVNSNTSSIDGFIDFVCDWLIKIGGVVALVGAVMFAVSWQREDAEGKTRALYTLMSGFMIMAIPAVRSLFGL